MDGHEDGLYFYRRIAAEAGKYLRDGAFLMLEIGWDQGEAVRGLLEAAGYQEVEVKKDLSGNDRVVRVTDYWKSRGGNERCLINWKICSSVWMRS